MKKTLEDKQHWVAYFQPFKICIIYLVITGNGYRIGILMNKKEVKYEMHTHITKFSLG